MYMIEKFTRAAIGHKDFEEKVVTPLPMGPNFSKEHAEQATSLELWGTSFSDQGADYCEWRLYDADGVLVDRKRVEGY